MTSQIPVAPISAHGLLLLLLQLGLLLMLALILGRLAVHLRMPAVIGELAAGVLLGPSLLAHLAPRVSAWLLPHDAVQLHLLDAVGYFGVLLLVGMTGMQIDLPLVRRKGAVLAWVSGGGLLVPFGLGVGLGFVLPASLFVAGGDRVVFAAFLGVALGVSAIPVIAKTLLDMRLLYRNIGQLIVNSAMVDDVLGWLLLSLVSALATTGLRDDLVALSVLRLVAVLIATVTLARPVMRAILRLSARSNEPGVGIAAVVVLLAAAGTHALGMEPMLGALLAGMLIGSSGRVTRHMLAPLHSMVLGVLAPIYFATAGLRMDVTALRRPVILGSAGLVLAMAIVGKFVGAYIGARITQLSHWEALALGSGLNARGVMQVIVATVGLRLGVLTTSAYTIIVLVAIVTSLMAPACLRYAVRRIEVTDEERVRERSFSAMAAAPSSAEAAPAMRYGLQPDDG